MIGRVEETSASFEARSAPRSYPTDLHRPRAVRWRPRGRRRSVGRGGHRPAIEPRKPRPGCRRCFERGRQHEQAHHRERLVDPAWSKNLACADALCAGTGRSRDRPFGNCRRSASGRRGAVADDARSREVRLCHSSWEADEQSGRDRAEPVEPRAEAKGNASQQSTRRTQSRVSVSHALERIRQAVMKNALPSHTQGGSRMPELGPYGSGAARLAAISAGESPANRGVQSLL
jgi:hypothetical protein